VRDGERNAAAARDSNGADTAVGTGTASVIGQTAGDARRRLSGVFGL
jgi:hypothetical protein